MNFFEKVYALVQQIPEGYVSTYGDIARAIGNSHMARQVGWALHANPSNQITPCHRVVNREGSLCTSFAFGGINIQKEKLEAEGVHVDKNYKVDLDEYRYIFKK